LLAYFLLPDLHYNSGSTSGGDNGNEMLYSASRDMTLRSWKLSLPTTNNNNDVESNNTSSEQMIGKGTSSGLFEGHTLTVTSVTASNDGRTVVSGGRDYAVKTWDAETCACLSTSKISRNIVTCISFFTGK
jgi:WD40 repeat protein